MMVLILERVPATLRGELSRWLIEPRVGVFVGDVSAMVRDRLWEKVTRDSRGGGAMLLHTSQTEQGFQVRIQGETTRDLVDWEGLTLVHIPSEVLPSGRKRAPSKHATAPETNAV
jgi:CRISPR-associated protein Cas2